MLPRKTEWPTDAQETPVDEAPGAEGGPRYADVRALQGHLLE